MVVEGTAFINIDGNKFKLCKNQSTYIKRNQKHQLSNNTFKDLIIIEIQTGSYLSEDDIVRITDVYGRV